MLKPLEDRVLIRQLKATEQTPGGIHNPEQARTKPNEGKVVAVGPGRTLDSGEVLKLDLEVNDHVLYGLHTGTMVEMEGEELLIVKFADILAKVS